ncbi:MAG: DUF192 domain-containing protein [Salinarimonadaceae bacterium]|nr:MAG: DUF192 domain-containing protein [Salinarimonadaceae bacterium]
MRSTARHLSRSIALRFLAIAVISCVALFAAPVTAQNFQPLTIVSGGERHEFQVEMADTPEARAQGLMFRRSMPQDRGMLFDFGRVDMVSMWMRNTYIPLDMLFIRQDGVIARIARDTEPLSERSISSGEPVLSVLELNAGVTARLGVEPGDRVEHPLFSR